MLWQCGALMRWQRTCGSAKPLFESVPVRQASSQRDYDALILLDAHTQPAAAATTA